MANELVLDNLKRLFKIGAKIWIRTPVIPSINDSMGEMGIIKALLDSCGEHEKVELLPYHAMGQNKYRAIGKKPQIIQSPDAEKMKHL